VALVRLVPLFPFNLVNYGFGLTRVEFRTYLFWSWLCMLPFTAVYVVGADMFVQGLESGEVPWPLVALFVILCSSLAVVMRRARRALAEIKLEISSP
jgi:uncharacterized membrane protein YdjX (TVP38/TMEM64 family)